jgi:hypothetical protein
MFKIPTAYICWKKIYKIHLKSSGTPVLYIGRAILKSQAIPAPTHVLKKLIRKEFLALFLVIM